MVKEVKARHILVGDKALAEQILENVKSGGNFEALAKKYSKCPSKDRGGVLGWFKRGRMVPEFERACFKKKKGLVENPVKTQFGWHIIDVMDSK